MKQLLLLLLVSVIPFLSLTQNNCNFESSNAYQICVDGGSQAIIIFEWFNAPESCEVTSVSYSTELGQGPFTYPIGQPYNVPAGNFGVYAGGPNMPPNWSVEHYLVVNYVDGTHSDTIAYTPTSCIPGCTDPNSESYNPWATEDDGSCEGADGSGDNCDPGDFEITVEVTLDSYPSETSWILTSLSDGGSPIQIPQGEYNFSDVGQTYSYPVCIDALGVELIVNDSYGDGLAGSTTGGTVDGTIYIYDCNGVVLWELPDPNFGSVGYSGPILGVPCNNIEPIPGCMNSSYQEYNPEANIDDGTCANLHVYGCIDTAAYNYNPDATINQIVETCNYTLWIGDAAADGWGNSYVGVYQDGETLGTYTMGPGLNEQIFSIPLNTNKPVEVYYFEVAGPQQPPQEVQFQTWHNSFRLTNADGVELMYEGSNPFADNGQGALQPFESPTWTTYSALPYCGDYCEPKIFGCMDSTSFNYNALANTDDGSCIPIVYGCTNDLAFNYNPDANIDDGTCISTVYGCMDPVSWNYNAEANIDDGSCIYFGCMDSLALNYDATANVDNGTCIYPILGCMDPESFNYDPLANVDDGSCIAVVYGCMDPTAFNYDPTANTDNGSCEQVIFGCIDSTALNYNPLANTDNGTCILPLTGCTDPNAFNYDPTANVSDSAACLYDAGCIGGPGNPYWLNNGCYAWVIDVDVYCCETEWDASCQSMYDYCEAGWPVGIDEMLTNGIVVYPNPTNDILNIKTHLSIVYELKDATGKVVLTGNDDRLYLNMLETGVYFLTITYEDKQFNKKIIKQ